MSVRGCPMKRLMLCMALAVPALLLAGSARADDKDKDKDKGGVTALPPSPLDGAFEKATDEKGIDEGLLNNDLYKKAVKAALKAKKDMEQKYKDNPKLKAETPAQAARRAFLNTLQEAAADDKPKDKEEKD